MIPTLEPSLMIPSLMDPSVMITHKKWGVTMTCDIPNFHARLFFEGLKDEGDPDSYFFQVAHLTGPTNFSCNGGPCRFEMSSVGSVDLSTEYERDDFKIRYRKKTQTWLRIREDIETLIHNIKQQVGKEVPFNICGRKSIFSKPVEIFEICDPLVAEIKKQSEILFLHLYDSAQNNGHYTGMSGESFTEAIAEVFKGINKYIIAETPSYEELVGKVFTATKVLQEHQNSCASWGIETLETVGIRVEDVALDKLLTVTTYYTKYEPGEIVPSEQNIDLSNEGNLISKKERVYERYVCYDIQRDKRTYTWQVLDDKYRTGKSLTIAGAVLLPVGALSAIAATIVSIMCPILLPFALTGIGAAVAGFLAPGAGMLGGGISMQKATLEEAKTTEGATQPGNATISPELKLQAQEEPVQTLPRYEPSRFLKLLLAGFGVEYVDGKYRPIGFAADR